MNRSGMLRSAAPRLIHRTPSRTWRARVALSHTCGTQGSGAFHTGGKNLLGTDYRFGTRGTPTVAPVAWRQGWVAGEIIPSCLLYSRPQYPRSFDDLGQPGARAGLRPPLRAASRRLGDRGKRTPRSRNRRWAKGGEADGGVRHRLTFPQGGKVTFTKYNYLEMPNCLREAVLGGSRPQPLTTSRRARAATSTPARSTSIWVTARMTASSMSPIRTPRASKRWFTCGALSPDPLVSK